MKCHYSWGSDPAKRANEQRKICEDLLDACRFKKFFVVGTCFCVSFWHIYCIAPLAENSYGQRRVYFGHLHIKS